MKETVLSIQNLSKNFGSIQAVNQLSLEIEKGTVFGLLGPNGSGKTTTLGILLDVINASSGSFSWFGQENSSAVRKRIGSILEVPLFYPYLSGYRNLKLIATIKGSPYEQIDEVLKQVGLYERKNSRFKTYSLGMKQRLALAAALLGDPEVLILDEPTNGLDPKGISEIRELILDVAKKGITIILASHILDEVQKICTHVAVMENGKKLFSGEVEKVLNESRWIEVASSNMPGLKIALEKMEEVISIQEEPIHFMVKLKEGYTAEMLNGKLFELNITISHLNPYKKSLEKYFLELLAKS